MKAWVIAAAAALAVSGAGATDLDHSGRSYAKSIHGVWVTDVTLVICATGAPVGVPTFKAINTFHTGGTMSEHDSRFSPALRNSGQGVWKRVGPGSYTSRFLFQRFDVNGLYIGTQEVQRRMTLSADGDSFSATATVRILDAAGVLVLQGCATEEGQRF